MLALAERQRVEQRNRHLRRWMIYLPVALTILGFLWFAAAFLRIIRSS